MEPPQPPPPLQPLARDQVGSSWAGKRAGGRAGGLPLARIQFLSPVGRKCASFSRPAGRPAGLRARSACWAPFISRLLALALAQIWPDFNGAWIRAKESKMAAIWPIKDGSAMRFRPRERLARPVQWRRAICQAGAVQCNASLCLCLCAQQARPSAGQRGARTRAGRPMGGAGPSTRPLTQTCALGKRAQESL